MTLVIAWCLSVVAGAAVSGWLGWHYGRAEGRHEGMCAERERWLVRQRRDRQAPRHAAIAPRARPVPAVQASRPPAPAAASQTGHASDREARLNAAVARHPSGRKRVVTTATADTIAPVIVPRPGTNVPMRPQAARTSGAGTQTMPRLTDTGEIRKLADDYIDRMRAEDIAWRAQNGLLG